MFTIQTFLGYLLFVKMSFLSSSSSLYRNDDEEYSIDENGDNFEDNNCKISNFDDSNYNDSLSDDYNNIRTGIKLIF